MKKLLISILLSTWVLVLSTPITQAWWIDSYDTIIEVQDSGKLLITETIDANFSDDPHHGIFRLIPNKIYNEKGQAEKLRLKLLSVTDEDYVPLPYTKSNSSTATQIKIGNANVLIQYPQTYVITYEVTNGIGYLEDHDELYWNAVGTEWEAEIYQATATVIFPETTEEIGDCFTGAYGSDERECTITHPSSNQINFTTTTTLNWYEGLTISVKFPKGLIDEPSEIWWILQDYGSIIIIPIILALLIRRWSRFGKDKKVHTIVPEYEPPEEITPVEASILIDEKAGMKDISAIMIDLAIRGFIKIEEIEEKTMGVFKKKKYHLHRLKFDQEGGLQLFEKELLNKLFTNETVIDLDDLKNKFYKHIPDLKDKMYKAAMEKKLFKKRPDKTIVGHMMAGIPFIIVGIISMAVAGGSYLIWPLTLGVSLFISGIFVIVFAFYMPQKTDQGHELFKKILGLKIYIKTAEQDRIKFHEKRQHFEKLLPYAMIFGQTKHWAKQFEDIYTEPPNWYTTQSWGAASVFSLGDFTHNLENVTSTISSSLSSSPGSSSSGGGGGGFSGGGGGGGGGGAW